MFQWVVYTCVALLIVHFVLYYCNMDLFQLFKKKKFAMSDMKDTLETCINELKSLEDTIDNGCTDPEFPTDTTPIF